MKFTSHKKESRKCATTMRTPGKPFYFYCNWNRSLPRRFHTAFAMQHSCSTAFVEFIRTVPPPHLPQELQCNFPVVDKHYQSRERMCLVLLLLLLRYSHGNSTRASHSVSIKGWEIITNQPFASHARERAPFEDPLLDRVCLRLCDVLFRSRHAFR